MAYESCTVAHHIGEQVEVLEKGSLGQVPPTMTTLLDKSRQLDIGELSVGCQCPLVGR